MSTKQDLHINSDENSVLSFRILLESLLVRKNRIYAIEHAHTIYSLVISYIRSPEIS